MNQTVVIGAIVVLLAAGGYYQFSYKPAMEQQAQAAIIKTTAVDFSLDDDLTLQCKVVKK